MTFMARLSAAGLQLQGTGVRVSVGYPPDTDTPGHTTENESKPEICWEVNDALGSDLFPVDKVRCEGLWCFRAAGSGRCCCLGPGLEVGQHAC